MAVHAALTLSFVSWIRSTRSPHRHKRCLVVKGFDRCASSVSCINKISKGTRKAISRRCYTIVRTTREGDLKIKTKLPFNMISSSDWPHPRSARWKAIQYWRLLALSYFSHCSKSKWSENRSKRQTNKTVHQTVCTGFDYSDLNFLRCCPKLKVRSLQYCNPDKTDKGRSNASISLTWLPLNKTLSLVPSVLPKNLQF